MDDFKENVIEFVQNSKVATVTFCQGRFISKIKELAKQYPDEVKITHTNPDGSIVAHIPTHYILISNRKRDVEYTEEELVTLRERIAYARKAKSESSEAE